MKKSVCIGIVIIMMAIMSGCATLQKKDMWEQGDWNWNRIKWVAETHLEGDVPRTIIKTKNGTTLIFQ